MRSSSANRPWRSRAASSRCRAAGLPDRKVRKAATGTKTPAIELNLDEVMAEYKTKSAAIRYLASQGHKRADIARFMGIRYQHVRNVLVQAAENEEAANKK